MTNVLLAYIKERNELCDRLATYYALNDIVWTIHTPFPVGTPGHIKVDEMTSEESE